METGTGLPRLVPAVLRRRRACAGSVTADGALDTRNCHNTIAARAAAAIIPHRRNSKR